jgi:hypothetical protein
LLNINKETPDRGSFTIGIFPFFMYDTAMRWALSFLLAATLFAGAAFWGSVSTAGLYPPGAANADPQAQEQLTLRYTNLGTPGLNFALGGSMTQGANTVAESAYRIYSAYAGYQHPSGWVDGKAGRIYSAIGPAWRGYVDGGTVSVGPPQYLAVQAAAGTTPNSYYTFQDGPEQSQVLSFGASSAFIPYTLLYGSWAQRTRSGRTIMQQDGYGASFYFLGNRIQPRAELTHDETLSRIAGYYYGVYVYPAQPNGTAEISRYPRKSWDFWNGWGAYAEYRRKSANIDKDTIFWVFRQKDVVRIKGGLSYRFAQWLTALVDANLAPRQDWQTTRWIRLGMGHQWRRFTFAEGYEGQKGYLANSDGGYLTTTWSPWDPLRASVDVHYQLRRGNRDANSNFIWRDVLGGTGEVGWKPWKGFEVFTGYRLQPNYRNGQTGQVYAGVNYNFFIFHEPLPK